MKLIIKLILFIYSHNLFNYFKFNPIKLLLDKRKKEKRKEKKKEKY